VKTWQKNGANKRARGRALVADRALLFYPRYPVWPQSEADIRRKRQKERKEEQRVGEIGERVEGQSM